MEAPHCRRCALHPSLSRNNAGVKLVLTSPKPPIELRDACFKPGKRAHIPPSMAMPMVDVREVGMFVGDGRMPMEVAVRLAAIPAKIMFMPVMRVVNVTMRMF